MRTRGYSTTARDLARFANVVNQLTGRGWSWAPYNYVQNGGSNGSQSAEEVNNGETTTTTRLPVDVWATDEAFQIAAYVPGLNPEDVELTFEADELTIRGTLAPAPEANYLRSELFHGSFERRLSFNIPVDGERIEANFHNGLLTVIVPKAESVRPKQIKIQAQAK
jgi:HSP20 family protein